MAVHHPIDVSVAALIGAGAGALAAPVDVEHGTASSRGSVPGSRRSAARPDRSLGFAPASPCIAGGVGMAGGTEETRGERRARRDEHAYLAQSEGLDDLQVVRAEGSHVYSTDGRRYVDFVMGSCVGNLGWSHPAVTERVRAFSGPDYVPPSQGYAPRAELARKLVELYPRPMKKVYRATGGSEAVDIALQVALAVTGRRGLVHVDGAYHGNCVGGVSVGDDETRAKLPNLLGSCHALKPPLDVGAVERVEALLASKEIAAVILEPIITNLEVMVPDARFMSELGRLCRESETLLILDEVATGFGRTGKLFAVEHFDLSPDIVCLAKAFSSGAAPMGATLVSEEVADALEGRLSFYSTYGWHPLGIEAALATVDFFRARGEELMRNVEARGRQFEERLRRMDFGTEATVTRKGLAIAVKFGSDDRADDLLERCQEAGLLVSGGGGSLRLTPALTINEGTVDEGLEILERCARRSASR
jgi:acetylornithine/succinyldiaminopimelate/putrescine aminotransferase